MKFKPLASLLYSTLLGIAISACSNSQLAEPRFATGSQIMATSSSYQALYVANTDQGTIGRVPVSGGAVEQIQVGSRPTRVARAGTNVFVTLRGERKVALLKEHGDKLTLSTTIDVGAEPYGIVSSEDGAKVYVAVSLEDKVLELDGKSGTVIRSFEVKNQPRWLALHPSGKTVYAVSAFGGVLTAIDVQSGTASVVPTQAIQTFNKGGVGGQIALTTRFTGDPAVSPQGDALLLPAFMVDNVSEVPDDTATDGTVPPPINPGSGYDAGRFNPVVVDVPLDVATGKPDVAVEHNVVIQVQAFSDTPKVSYPTSVTIDPTGEYAVVTMEGAAGGVTFRVHDDAASNSLLPGGPAGAADIAAPAPAGGARAVFPGGGQGFAFRSTAAFNAAAGTRGVAFTEGQGAFVYGFLDNSVGKLDLAPIEKQLNPPKSDLVFAKESAPADVSVGGFKSTSGFSTVGEIKVADDVLSEVELRGRRLFFAANDTRMSSSGSGVSCAGCHADGRNDGLTWNFTRGGRQTPSLAGHISLQAPVRWEGDSPTVSEDAFRTSQGLMGGQGLSQDDANAIQAFLDTTPEVDAPLKGSADPAVARGKAIFEREDVGCVSCHAGDRLTNKQKYEMFGLNVQTRPLVGVAASAPYLHDGSAATLLEVVQRASEMQAKTSQLSGDEVSDLVKYLESL
ncbi:MAG: c-type cytochrome [Myxococcota bacterium]